MPVGNARSVRRRRGFLKALFWGLILAAAILFAFKQKDVLITEGALFLEKAIERETGLRVHVERVGGHLGGYLRLDGFSVVDPAAAGESPIFEARRIEVRYRLLDFLSKRFGSKITLKIRDVNVHWTSGSGLKRDSFPVIRWLRDWILAQKDNWQIEAQNVRFLARGRRPIEDISFTLKGDAFEGVVPFRHEDWFGADLSTTVRIAARFSLGLGRAGDALSGTLSTEGTVVNWAPLAQESSLDFVMTKDRLGLGPSIILGGIRCEGELSFSEGPDLNLSLSAEHYSLLFWAPFLRIDRNAPLPTRMDFDIHLQGNPWSPTMEAYGRIYDGWIGGNRFKALDLHLDGVYPSFRLTDSRILLTDDTVMKFADTALEASEVFSEKVFRRLVSDAQQDTVVWGKWELKRAPGEQEDDFLMQRSLGRRAQLQFRKYGEPEKDERDPSDPRKMEVGLVYKLKASDSLKFGLRDDERFVGVEHKSSF